MNDDMLEITHESFESASLNTADERILEQVNRNIRRGLPQARPYQPNQQVAILVAGGPSLNDPEVMRELVDAYWAGGKVVTVNGAYDWCIERNIRPSMQVVLDAREKSARFVGKPVPGCTYFLASQVHPSAFEACRSRQVTIWHCCSTGEGEYEALKEFYFGGLNPVTIGTTVAIRAISLLRLLGFLRIHVFGLDSCVLDEKGVSHHAYGQPENDGEGILPIWLKGPNGFAQRFLCVNWHVKQAMDFMTLVEERGDMLQLKVHGPGLIAAMLRTGATMETEST